MDFELNTRYGAEITMTTDSVQFTETVYDRETKIDVNVLDNVSDLLLDMLNAYTGEEDYNPELLTKLISNCIKRDGLQGLKDILIDLDVDLEEFSGMLKE